MITKLEKFKMNPSRLVLQMLCLPFSIENVVL